MARLYEIELWDMSGNRIGDISHLAQNRHYTIQRNEAETLNFDLDLSEWEDYCDNTAKLDPMNLMNPLQTHIRVKRNGDYIFGCQVVDMELQAGADNQTITVTATGYLNFFLTRYVTNTYTQTEATSIAWGLINATQTVSNGDMGITLASNQYATGVLRDRTYARQQVKSGLQDLTSLVDGNFDFWFSADKQFYTAAQQGALRDDLTLIFGGPQANIAQLYYPRSGLSTYNYVYGLGSGFGPDQLVSQQSNTDSIKAYYRREDIEQYNSVTDQTTLDQNTAAAVQANKDLLEIPQVTITTNELVGKPFLSVGDRIPAMADGHSYLREMNQHYRIEKLDVTIDDNDFENIVQYFDSQGVDQNE